MGAGMCRISPRLVSYGRVNSDIDLRLGPELPLLFVECERLFPHIERVLADLVMRWWGFLFGHAMYTAQHSVYTQLQLLHEKGLVDVIVSPAEEAVDRILPHAFRRQEDDGHLRVLVADLPGEGQSILHGHHHVQ